MNALDSRREELQRRCQRERNQFIAAGAATAARLPNARQIARWMRFARRMLRGFRPGIASTTP